MTETPGRLAAALSDRYAIERELGAGGMATVYLAQDLKHDRKVALKVLRPELAAVLGAERFVVEIKTTAALQHPHILPLFDSGAADGFLYYVMPFIDGETLRNKLDRETQLGIDEAVRITREVADALDYAHRHGVIHRDIKPENILLHDGRPMVADFGIALAVSAAAGGRMTETGMSLGTPHYMSPEQATAEKDLTARSDVYSLGSVLYEMLTGEPPHTGASAQAIIMKIVTDRARPVTDLRKSVPPNVAAAVAKALEKLPADRFGSAVEFGSALADVHFTTAGGLAARGADRRGSAWWQDGRPWALAVGLAVVASAGVWFTTRRATPEPLVARFRVPIESERGVTGAPVNTLALSPDARTVVYVGRTVGGTGSQLYERRLDELSARPIAGTEGGSFPAFSPDGRRLVYVGTNGVFVLSVPFETGAPTRVASVSSQALASVTWLDPSGLVITNGEGAIERVGLDGASTVLARPDTAAGERNLFVQVALPDGHTVIAIASAGANAIGRVVALDTRSGERRALIETPANAAWYTDGCLIWSLPNGALMAAPIDAASGRTIGSAVALADGVRQAVGGGGQAAVSHTGSIVYLPDQPFSLMLVDRTGRREVVAEERRFHSPRFSPDGRRLALDFIQQGSRDVWTLDLRQRTMTRVSFEDDGHDPIWSPDGRWIAYVHGNGVWRRRADGSGSPDSVYVGFVAASPLDYLPDGNRMFVALTATVGFDVGLVEPGSSDGVEVLLGTPFGEQAATTSPDGRWMAYSSDETGRDEIYIRPFPEGGGKLLVSQGGGTEPRWSRDGRTLFYYGQSGGLPHLIAATIQTRPDLSVDARTPLFDVSEFEPAAPHANYDVSPDGTRFAMVHQGPLSEMVFVLNATAEVRRRSTRGE
jgi:eukaryotic-like serine/threonine-protein kinase